MGVPTFYRWLKDKYPKCIVPVREDETVEIDGVAVPPDMMNPNPNGIEFDNLYIDMNGIIHPCSHPEDEPPPETEEDMYILIMKYIDRLMTAVRPRKLLYMAIDGVAPRAKMNQQRSRRFKAAQEMREREEVEADIRMRMIANGFRPPTKKGPSFDSNVITPGTEFMDRLSTFLQFYIVDRKSNNPAWRDVNVILSDAYAPGEGEHKIMEYIRQQRAHPNYNPNTRHVLHGLDADLIMLGLATHEVHFTVLREEVFPPRQTPKCFICGQEGHMAVNCRGKRKSPDPEKAGGKGGVVVSRFLSKPLQFLHLSILRDYLEIEYRSLERSLRFPFSLERIIDDFILLCFFVGNDFLPHLPSMEIREGAIDMLITLYKRMLPEEDDYITNCGSVDLARALRIMGFVGRAEDEIFKRRHRAELADKQVQEQRKSFQSTRYNPNSNNSNKNAKNRSANYFANGPNNQEEAKEEENPISKFITNRVKSRRSDIEKLFASPASSDNTTAPTAPVPSATPSGAVITAAAAPGGKLSILSSLDKLRSAGFMKSGAATADNASAASALRKSLHSAPLAAASGVSEDVPSTTAVKRALSTSSSDVEADSVDQGLSKRARHADSAAADVDAKKESEEEKEENDTLFIKPQIDECYDLSKSSMVQNTIESIKSKVAAAAESDSAVLATTSVSVDVTPIHTNDDDETKNLLSDAVSAALLKRHTHDDVQDSVKFAEEGFRNRYYLSKFRPELKQMFYPSTPSSDGVVGGSSLSFDEETEEDRRRVYTQAQIDAVAREIARNYVEGLIWVFRYYFQGVASWKWYYPHHYSPLASDIGALLEYVNTPILNRPLPSMSTDVSTTHSKSTKWEIHFELGRPFTPLEQLMAVLPARSSHAVPEALARLMIDPKSPIIDFYPVDFRQDPNGKPFQWQWVVLLPFIDPVRLSGAVSAVLSDITSVPVAALRRNRLGNELLFSGSFSPLGALLRPLRLSLREADRLANGQGFVLEGEQLKEAEKSAKSAEDSLVWNRPGNEPDAAKAISPAVLYAMVLADADNSASSKEGTARHKNSVLLTPQATAADRKGIAGTAVSLVDGCPQATPIQYDPAERVDSFDSIKTVSEVFENDRESLQKVKEGFYKAPSSRFRNLTDVTVEACVLLPPVRRTHFCDLLNGVHIEPSILDPLNDDASGVVPRLSKGMYLVDLAQKLPLFKGHGVGEYGSRAGDFDYDRQNPHFRHDLSHQSWRQNSAGYASNYNNTGSYNSNQNYNNNNYYNNNQYYQGRNQSQTRPQANYSGGAEYGNVIPGQYNRPNQQMRQPNYSNNTGYTGGYSGGYHHPPRDQIPYPIPPQAPPQVPPQAPPAPYVHRPYRPGAAVPPPAAFDPTMNYGAPPQGGYTGMPSSGPHVGGPTGPGGSVNKSGGFSFKPGRR